MSVLRLELGERSEVVNLGEIEEHGTTGGELAYSGNVYLFIDGREYGSLFINRAADGSPQITLGQFRADEEWWVEANPIQEIPDPLPL